VQVSGWVSETKILPFEKGDSRKKLETYKARSKHTSPPKAKQAFVFCFWHLFIPGFFISPMQIPPSPSKP
jgi:hypothetical protein